MLVRSVVLVLLLLCGGGAWAAGPTPGSPCDSSIETCWKRARVAPYGNASVEKALDALLTSDLIARTEDRARIRALVLAGRPTSIGEILPNDRITRMVFSGLRVLSNIVAVTDEWRGATTRVDYYQMTLEDGTIVIVGRPHICSNWFITIITPQGECVKDQILCDAGCETLRRQVSSLKGWWRSPTDSARHLISFDTFVCECTWEYGEDYLPNLLL